MRKVLAEIVTILESLNERITAFELDGEGGGYQRGEEMRKDIAALKAVIGQNT